MGSQSYPWGRMWPMPVTYEFVAGPAALAQRGISGERLSQLKAPAGLDLGAITPDEIAISILAEIVAVRRGKAREG